MASSYKAKKRWLACETLVIDEISMLDASTFDKLDHVARYVRGNDKPFGGVQLLCCGDFLQLPPVSARGGFAFEAKCWRRCFPEQRALTRVFRQSGDDAFLQILGELRIAKLSNKSAALLRRLKHTDLSEWTSRGIEPTRLQCYNADVDSINEARLKALKTAPEHLPCVDKGDGERYARHHPYAATLKLKIGAQVMLLSNLDVSAGLANGARGVVEEFVRAPSRSVDGVVVRWASGKTTTVDRDAKTVEEGGREVFSRSQFPLRLAWAVTIHKAQGQTLDLLEVDLRGCREFGQAYVAVSRATAMKKLRVLNFDPSVVRAHPRAVEYVDRLLSRDPRAVYEDEASSNPIFAPANDDGWISTKKQAPPAAPPPRRGPPQPVQRGPPAVAPRAGPPAPKRAAPPAAKRAGPPAPKLAAPPAAKSGAAAGATHGEATRAGATNYAVAAAARAPDDTGQTCHARGRPHAVAAAGVVARRGRRRHRREDRRRERVLRSPRRHHGRRVARRVLRVLPERAAPRHQVSLGAGVLRDALVCPCPRPTSGPLTSKFHSKVLHV